MKDFHAQLRRSIVEILLAHGESFQADNDVDKKVCAKVAKEIIKHLRRQPIRVMVAVRGGCVQGALADLPNVALEIWDYDVFESEPKDDCGRTKDEAERQWEDAQLAMHAIF